MNFQTTFSKSSRPSTWKLLVSWFTSWSSGGKKRNARWNRFRNLIRLKKVWTSADNFTYVAATGETILSSFPYPKQKWIALSFLRSGSRLLNHSYFIIRGRINRVYRVTSEVQIQSDVLLIQGKKNYVCHACKINLIIWINNFSNNWFSNLCYKTIGHWDIVS